MTGTIILWYGAIANIPSGWKLCDGNSGTPDLRNYVPVCAGDTYAVGASGGATTHQHAFMSNTHQHSLPAGANTSGPPPNLDPLTTSDTVVGNVDNADDLPPYKALCYIQYTGF